MNVTMLIAYIRQTDEFVEYCFTDYPRSDQMHIKFDLQFLAERANEIIRNQGQHGRRDILDSIRYLEKGSG